MPIFVFVGRPFSCTMFRYSFIVRKISKYLKILISKRREHFEFQKLINKIRKLFFLHIEFPSLEEYPQISGRFQIHTDEKSLRILSRTSIAKINGWIFRLLHSKIAHFSNEICGISVFVYEIENVPSIENIQQWTHELRMLMSEHWKFYESGG